MLEAECFVQMFVWTKHSAKISLAPSCRAILWHNAPARERLRKCCYDSVQQCLHKYQTYWNRSWTAWDPVMWKRREATRVGRRMCRFEKKTTFFLSSICHLFVHAGIFVPNRNSTSKSFLHVAGALCQIMALLGGTKETFVARTGSFKVSTSFGRSIWPWALAKYLEHTHAWSFSVKFTLPILRIHCFNTSLFWSGSQ